MRWNGLREEWYAELCGALNDFAMESFEAMRDELFRKLKEKRPMPKHYLEHHYLRWICHSQMNAFYSNLRHDGKEAVVI